MASEVVVVVVATDVPRNGGLIWPDDVDGVMSGQVTLPQALPVRQQPPPREAGQDLKPVVQVRRSEVVDVVDISVVVVIVVVGVVLLDVGLPKGPVTTVVVSVVMLSEATVERGSEVEVELGVGVT